MAVLALTLIVAQLLLPVLTSIQTPSTRFVALFGTQVTVPERVILAVNEGAGADDAAAVPAKLATAIAAANKLTVSARHDLLPEKAIKPPKVTQNSQSDI